MLDEKDSINLDRAVIQGLRDQLTIQEASTLYLVRSGQLCVSTQIAIEKDYLDGLAKDLTKKMGKILLTASTTKLM